MTDLGEYGARCCECCGDRTTFSNVALICPLCIVECSPGGCVVGPEGDGPADG